MNHPHTRPVTVTEIADLLAQLRALSPPQPDDAAARVVFLAAKADLLARINQTEDHQ
jgi:hypothetical protein